MRSVLSQRNDERQGGLTKIPCPPGLVPKPEWASMIMEDRKVLDVEIVIDSQQKRSHFECSPNSRLVHCSKLSHICSIHIGTPMLSNAHAVQILRVMASKLHNGVDWIQPIVGR